MSNKLLKKWLDVAENLLGIAGFKIKLYSSIYKCILHLLMELHVSFMSRTYEQHEQVFNCNSETLHRIMECCK